MSYGTRSALKRALALLDGCKNKEDDTTTKAVCLGLVPEKPLQQQQQLQQPLSPPVPALPAPAEGGGYQQVLPEVPPQVAATESRGVSPAGDRRRDLRPEFDECIELMDKLKRAKLLKVGDLSKAVGLPGKQILEKVYDGTLDPVHLRKTGEYLKEIVEIGNQLVGTFRPKMLHCGGVSRKEKSSSSSCSSGGSSVLVACPLLAMGYTGLTCTEIMPKNEVLQHVSCHVATLWKRVEQLEMDLADHIQSSSNNRDAAAPRLPSLGHVLSLL